jgi:hypothetical protein
MQQRRARGLTLLVGSWLTMQASAPVAVMREVGAAACGLAASAAAVLAASAAPAPAWLLEGASLLPVPVSLPGLLLRAACASRVAAPIGLMHAGEHACEGRTL